MNAYVVLFPGVLLVAAGKAKISSSTGILPQSCADYWNDDHFEDRYVILLSRYMQQSCRQCCDVRT